MSAVTDKQRSTLRFAAQLMLGAVVGKVLGFVREILFAKHLGATAAADSFRAAMTAVLLPIAPLQGDLIPSTLVPLFLEWRREGRSVRMASSLCMVFTASATLLAVLIAVYAEVYVDLLLGGFSPEAKAMTAAFTRAMTPAMPASVLIAYFGCVEIALGRSRITSIRPSVQNVSVLIGIGVMSWTGEVIAIAWAFTAGLVLVALYGLAMLWREGEISPRAVRIGSGFEAVAVFFRRGRPLLIQPLAEQGNTLLERMLASALAVGTMASLDYARTITETVYYAVSQPVGYVVLGHEKAIDLRERVRALCSPILHLALPASAFVITFASDITAVVFGRGAFKAEAIASTALAMQGIAIGLWATTLGWILLRMLNADQRNGTAARILACAYAANMIVNVAMYRWLGLFGLGLGEAMRGLVLLGGTAYALGCTGVLLRLIARAAPVTLALAATGLLLQSGVHTPLMRLLAGTGLYGLVLVPWLLFGVPEMAWFRHRVFSRWTKSEPRVTAPGDAATAAWEARTLPNEASGNRAP
ncbi:lipid II flippase MurJ [Methylobacterium goesingense]|nr:lipid II flippase MurJ [Methylobacterium goesingense]